MLFEGLGRVDLFFKSTHRNVGYVIDHLGDRALDAYSSSDAASFRDYLINKELASTSIKRIFSIDNDALT